MIYFLFKPTITNDENGIIIERDRGMGVKLEWVRGGGGGGGGAKGAKQKPYVGTISNKYTEELYIY